MIKAITNKGVILFLFVVQFITLVMFPPQSFSTTSQEWWLPLVLALLALIAVVRLIWRGGEVSWPWYLLAFSQGFNIISRILMLMPHSSVMVDGQVVFNTSYVVLTVISMAFSGFFLWYLELPEVRINMIKQGK